MRFGNARSLGKGVLDGAVLVSGTYKILTKQNGASRLNTMSGLNSPLQDGGVVFYGEGCLLRGGGTVTIKQGEIVYDAD